MTWADPKEARILALWLHRDQTDKSGARYEAHLCDVAAKTAQLCKHIGIGDESTEKLRAAAWLHDSVEDGHATLEEIERFQGGSVAEYVDCVTHKEGQSYADYIVEIGGYSQWVYVLKIADLLSNLNPARMALLDEKDRKRLTTKYQSALGFLVAAHPELIGAR